MRHLRVRDVPAEVWSIVINAVVIAAIAFIGQDTKAVAREVQWIALTIVPAVTLVILAFKRDLDTTISRNVRLYRLVSEIRDRELQKLALERIRKLSVAMEDLARGILSAPPEELFPLLARKVADAKLVVRATHVAMAPDEVKLWSSPSAKYYYDINKQLIAKGRQIHRCFILRRQTFFDPLSKAFDSDAAAVIRQHAADGITVHIVWEEEIRERAFWQDYVIVDDSLTIINEPTGAVYSGGWRTWIMKNSDETEEFINRFESLIASHGRTVDDALAGPVISIRGTAEAAPAPVAHHQPTLPVNAS